MKVALIGDVHANLPALEAVLDHARREGAEAVWNVGDSVGYGPYPNQALDRLREPATVNIVGNYDLDVLEFKKKRKKWRKTKQLEKFLAFQWAHDALTGESREFLRSLPTEQELHVNGLTVLLTHGSPTSIDEHLRPSTPEARLRELASITEADVVVCGHSHQAFVRCVDGVCFVNTGSVGRPDDGDPRACYALLTIGGAGDQGFNVHHYRVAYDMGSAVVAIRERRLPEAFAQMLIQGYALDKVMEAPETWDVPVSHDRPRDDAEREELLEAVHRLANSSHYEEQHTRHVTWLSLRLFDELLPLHRLGPQDRFWLRCAALLHDIGWIDGRKGHHKTSLRLVLKSLDGPFDERERRIIGSVARYHRGALPKDKHRHFATLSPTDQYRVTILASLLRVADGLDRRHRREVQEVACQWTPRQILIRCDVRMYPVPEREAALEKGDLLERAFDRELVIEWRAVRDR